MLITVAIFQFALIVLMSAILGVMLSRRSLLLSCATIMVPILTLPLLFIGSVDEYAGAWISLVGLVNLLFLLSIVFSWILSRQEKMSALHSLHDSLPFVYRASGVFFFCASGLFALVYKSKHMIHFGGVNDLVIPMLGPIVIIIGFGVGIRWSFWKISQRYVKREIPLSLNDRVLLLALALMFIPVALTFVAW